MSPTRSFLAFAVAVAVLAGCLRDAPGDAPVAPSDPNRLVGAALAAADLSKVPAFTTLLCHSGIRLLPYANATEVLDDCNFEVTTRNAEGNEVTIAVNPKNPLNVIASSKDYTLGKDGSCGQWNVWLGAYWSMDGGKTWGNDLIPGHPKDNRSSPLKGNTCNTDPVALFDADGTAWLSGLNYAGKRDDSPTAPVPPNQAEQHDLYTGSQVYFAKSTDGGATFPSITFAAFGDNNLIFNDKQWYAANPTTDDMILTWSQFYQAVDEIMYSFSRDAGRTWSDPQPLHGLLGGVSVGQFSMPAYGPNGELYVIWNGLGSGPEGSGIVFTSAVARDAATGRPAFTPAREVQPTNEIAGNCRWRMSTYPVLAVDTSAGPRKGRLYLTWADDRHDLADVLLSWSDDQGATWSAPTRVNDDEGEARQVMPWIDVDPMGDLHLAWTDSRDSDDECFYDLYYAHSADGGQSFDKNLRISEATSDPKFAHHQSGAQFIGDYIGIDASATAVHFVWPDTRHGTSDVYSATLLRNAADWALYDGKPSTAGYVAPFHAPPTTTAAS